MSLIAHCAIPLLFGMLPVVRNLWLTHPVQRDRAIFLWYALWLVTPVICWNIGLTGPGWLYLTIPVTGLIMGILSDSYPNF